MLAVNSLVLGLLFPVGTLVQGAIADATSLRAVTAGSGVMLACVLLVMWAWDRGRSSPVTAETQSTVDGSQLLPHTTTTTRSPRSGT